jgi:hypothetical protein
MTRRKKLAVAGIVVALALAAGAGVAVMGGYGRTGPASRIRVRPILAPPDKRTESLHDQYVNSVRGPVVHFSSACPCPSSCSWRR